MSKDRAMSEGISVVEWFKGEFTTIASAPFTFITACLLIGIGVWLFLRWIYQERLVTKDSHINFLTAQVAGRTPVESNEEATEEEIPPNYEHWAFVPVLAFWQIAWLWVDQEPMPHVTPGTRAYPILNMLKEDARAGTLPHRLSPDGTINVWAAASREDLKPYATAKGQRPRFLFDR